MDFQDGLLSFGSFLIGLQIEREGKDITITAFSKMVGYALQVMWIPSYHSFNGITLSIVLLYIVPIRCLLLKFDQNRATTIRKDRLYWIGLLPKMVADEIVLLKCGKTRNLWILSIWFFFLYLWVLTYHLETIFVDVPIFKSRMRRTEVDNTSAQTYLP
jgi:hypothetical protein